VSPLPIDSVLDAIAALPKDWHGAGSVSEATLRAIAARAGSAGPIERSVETGCGKTTLLLSHLSARHTTFAVDDGNSITQVRASPLLAAERVEVVEGPTQRTLPTFELPSEVQLALIDGPHGYPFPDLEYLYFYPLLRTGGLLLIDDIEIPTIRRMFDIVQAEDMFDLLEVVDEMAFLRRTEAPLIEPTSDSWWLQGYNRDHYEALQRRKRRAGSSSRRILRAFARRTGIARLVPQRLKRLL
jgi:hypothetical protein